MKIAVQTIQRSEVDKILQDNKAAIESAQATSQQITKTLERSRKIDRVVIPRLKRKGVVH